MSGTILFKSAAPSAAKTLGWELIAERPEAGEVEIAFHPNETMLNPHGTVQGGFIAAMLDDTMGPALVVQSGGARVPASIDLNVSFLKPVHPGRVIAKGRVVSAGKSIAFLEAELFDETGALLARATSSARVIERG